MANDTLVPSPENAFGSNTPCTLAVCPVEWSLYGYRPSLVANIVLLALYGAICLVHLYLGIRWKRWGFMGGMIAGCASEMIGYAGRILLWDNPFSFNAFMIQIVCLTIAPVFYTASIYVTLSSTISFLGPEVSRFNPKYFYWFFIPFDLVCLCLQSAGGALSTGDSSFGVDLSMAGLILQVVVLVLFIIAFSDYMIRYFRSGRASHFQWRLKAFFAGLTTAILLILLRCIYRVAELQDGYDGKLIKEEVPFVLLEGVVIFLAASALAFGHPGLGLNHIQRGGDGEKGIPLRGNSQSIDSSFAMNQ
ncbi:hypothetical protein G7046_g8205 [Stylonectria norvegica]|nr:hypothetical protein G7046_g8205 [Stylonectria norvegica]